ncbi:hypothetical protein BH09BAC5_BH09BAC5_12070 [soil metagenome]
MKAISKIVFPVFFIFTSLAFVSVQNDSDRKENVADDKNVIPVTDSTSLKFIQIAAGGDFSLALRSDGTVWSWGNNKYGELGCGDMKKSAFPIQITTLTDIVAISAGPRHGLALKKDSTVWAWGDNTFGELGNGTNVSSRLPFQVDSISGVIAIAAGGAELDVISSGYTSGSTFSIYFSIVCFSVVLKSDGTVWHWGTYSKCRGQDRDTVVQHYWRPKQLMSVTNIISIAAGGAHGLALREDGTVWAWGGNMSAQLGDGTHDSRCFAAQVFGMTGITAISAGGERSMALAGDSTIWFWGDMPPVYNQTHEFNFDPVHMKNLQGIISISVGVHHCLVLNKYGIIYSWGMGGSGQLGSKKQYSKKVIKVQAMGKVSAISAGAEHSMAIKWDGTVWAWGENYDGRLGNGGKKDMNFPVPCGKISGK